MAGLQGLQYGALPHQASVEGGQPFSQGMIRPFQRVFAGSIAKRIA
jgi:hypothetical protein